MTINDFHNKLLVIVNHLYHKGIIPEYQIVDSDFYNYFDKAQKISTETINRKLRILSQKGVLETIKVGRRARFKPVHPMLRFEDPIKFYNDTFGVSG